MKHSRYFLLTAFLLAACQILLCQAQEVFLDNLELPEFNAPLAQTRQSSPCDILKTLFSQTHLNRILENDILYKYTFPLGQRNILTYPSLYTFTPPNGQFNWSIFYQNMPTIFPFANGVDGYLNIFNNIVLHTLDIEIAHEYGIQVPRLISLFQNTVAEQRRIGFMFDFWERIKWFNFGLQWPFYAVARNYNFPIEDRQEIQHSLAATIRNINATSDTDTGATDKRAAYPYVLETRIGCGDLRLSMAGRLIEKKYAKLLVGTKITLPTAGTLKSGFVGSDFSKCLTRPYLDLETIIEQLAGDAYTKAQALASIRSFSIATLYQMDDTLLATQLDDNKRTQLAIYLDPTVYVSGQIDLLAELRANWLLSKKVCRFIKPCVNPADFADSNFDAESWDVPTDICNTRAYTALRFLSERLQDVCMPPQYLVTLMPQFEIQLTIGSRIQFTDNWQFFVGYDYWMRHGECTNTVTTCQGASMPLCSLQVPTALIPRVAQQKFVLKAEYTKFKAHHNFTFTVGGDLPITSSNIADDYTAFVRFEWAL